jgi:hypothetical protein
MNGVDLTRRVRRQRRAIIIYTGRGSRRLRMLLGLPERTVHAKRPIRIIGSLPQICGVVRENEQDN